MAKRIRDREEMRRNYQAYRLRHLDRIRAEKRAAYHRQSVEKKAQNHLAHIRARYKVSDEEARRLDGITLCDICGGFNENGRRLAVDHNHQTGKIRGRLCEPCNTGLGRFRDDIELLRKAVQYLAERD